MLEEIGVISKETARNFIIQHHYSVVMPRITKHCLGGFHNDELVAVMTLGWGTRPLHTIKKIFPTLTTKNYLELGKLCVSDKMPKNTESFFISRCIRWIKQNLPDCLLIYSWADGIVGKPGYVYQASNFYYGGYIWTEMYLDPQGNRCHVRSIQGHPDLPKSSGRFKTRAFAEIQKLGYSKVYGLQFRYVYPLCNKWKWKELLQTTTVTWERRNFPKDSSCMWKKQIARGKLEPCEMPKGIKSKYIRVPGFLKDKEL